MLRRTKENFITLAVIFVGNLLFLHSSIQLEFFESKIMPIFISGILFLLLIMSFYNEWTKLSCEALSEDEGVQDITAKDMKTVKCILPLFILAGLIWIMGFYAATLVFVFGYMKVNKSSLASSLIIATAATVFVYVVFPILLETPLYTGLIAQEFNLPF